MILPGRFVWLYIYTHDRPDMGTHLGNNSTLVLNPEAGVGKKTKKQQQILGSLQTPLLSLYASVQ